MIIHSARKLRYGVMPYAFLVRMDMKDSVPNNTSAHIPMPNSTAVIKYLVFLRLISSISPAVKPQKTRGFSLFICFYSFPFSCFCVYQQELLKSVFRAIPVCREYITCNKFSESVSAFFCYIGYLRF